MDIPGSFRGLDVHGVKGVGIHFLSFHEVFYQSF